MTYTPDITRYQQLVRGGSTGPYDCSAWSSALITDAHTRGGVPLSGRSIRLASSEPIPDPRSPGLNLPQTDAAVYNLTAGRVNLDTRVQGHALTRSQAQALIIDGRWAVVQVQRGILVDRTALTGFRGAHALTVHARPIDNAPVIGDPLHAQYVVASWDAVWDAAEALVRAFAPGKVYTQHTRDLTPDYRVTVKPKPGYDRLRFGRFFLDSRGVITRVEYAFTGGFGAACTPPKWHGGSHGIAGRQLVQLTSGSRKGWWINAKYADEVIP